MLDSGKLLNTFSIIIGTFLIIEGVWGLFSDVVFGVLTTNTTHAVIHIILGVLGIYFGARHNARGYCLFLGSLLVVVGLLRFVPGPDQILVNILNVNDAVAYFNIVAGTLTLILAFATRSRTRVFIPGK